MKRLLLGLVALAITASGVQAKYWYFVANDDCVAVDNLDTPYGQLGFVNDHSGKMHNPADVKQFLRSTGAIVDKEEDFSDDVIRFRLVIPDKSSGYIMMLFQDNQPTCQYLLGALIKAAKQR